MLHSGTPVPPGILLTTTTTFSTTYSPVTTHLLPLNPVQPNPQFTVTYVVNYCCFANKDSWLYNANFYEVYVKKTRLDYYSLRVCFLL